MPDRHGVTGISTRRVGETRLNALNRDSFE
jgi:hypothetical protein